MPIEDDFEAGGERIKEHIRRVGDEIEEETSGEFELEDGEPVEYQTIIAHEESYNCIYTVTGRRDLNLYVLRYSYDFLSRLENFLTTDAGEEVFELDEFATADPPEAAQTIINRVSDEDLRRLRFKLHEQISNPETISRLTGEESVGIRGFVVYRHLFPSEDNWGLPDFYKTLTAVTSTGEKGKRYLNNSFAIQVPEDEKEGEYSLSFDPEDVFS